MTTRDLWKRALGQGAQWRVLALFVVGMLLPAGAVFAPVASFLESLFDHSPRATDLVARLDSSAFTEVLRQLGEPGAEAIKAGVHGAIALALIIAPALAGATVAVARENAKPLRVGELLGAAGELYPRMLRMALVALLPLGIAAGGAALAFHLAGKASERAVHEPSADRATLAATLASVLLVWLAHATVEAGRAHFATQPQRRSAFLAWWSGVRLVVRHPLRVLGLCLLTTLVGVGGALLVTAVRYRITQAGTGTVALAFLLTQVAVAAIGWGRASRLVGLAELIREKTPA